MAAPMRRYWAVAGSAARRPPAKVSRPSWCRMTETTCARCAQIGGTSRTGNTTAIQASPPRNRVVSTAAPYTTATTNGSTGSTAFSRPRVASLSTERPRAKRELLVPRTSQDTTQTAP